MMIRVRLNSSANRWTGAILGCALLLAGSCVFAQDWPQWRGANRDGKLLWKLPFVPQRRAYNAATPIVDGQTVIYTGAGRGTKAVKIEKQGDGFAPKELWSNPELATQYNTPVLVDGLLFGLSDRGKLFCINAKTGQTAWIDATARDRRGFGAIVCAGPVRKAQNRPF